jgi:4-hydroxybenzoate polyprenyltransferase/phosphoserine phosphatase
MQLGTKLPPIVVDLDGTLIRTDMLHESALRVMRDKPLHLLRIPYWLTRGKAFLKSRLASQTDFDPASLPYNQDVLAWLRVQRDAGRRLILCTASDRTIAEPIAEYVGLFDEVMASEGTANLAGRNKAAALEERFGRGGYDYVGNSSADLHVWQSARRAIVVNASERLAREAAKVCEVEQEFPSPALGLGIVRRVLRAHQWMKNVLLFVPLLAAHDVFNAESWIALVLAFISFSLCASTVYIANDLFDLESDRAHPRKRARPFASGAVPAWVGVAVAPVLFAVSLLIGRLVGTAFLGWLLVYFVVTCVYSWRLKKLVLVDCLTLAVLYTLRIIAGGAAAGLPMSFWLLAFSLFLFLSLAFVKRYAELQLQSSLGKEKVHGRGYGTADAPLIQMLGINTGVAAVVVLALYLNSDAIMAQYRKPELVMGAVPVVLFWISWIWLQTHRGNMHDDPVVFAVKDKVSLIAGVVFAIVVGLGAVGLPW